MNCPNCGRPLAEGEVCNCMNNEPAFAPEVAAAPVTEQPPVMPEQPPVMPEQPPVMSEQQTFYQPPQEAFNAQYNDYAQQQQQQQYYVPPVAPAAPVPAVDVPARTDYPEGYRIKKKYVAVILAAVFGPLGLHNFYLGNKNKGLAQLLVCLIGSLFVGLGYIAAEIWAIVDCIQLLTEKQDKDFNGFKIRTLEESIVAEKMKAEKALQETEEE